MKVGRSLDPVTLAPSTMARDSQCRTIESLIFKNSAPEVSMQNWFRKDLVRGERIRGPESAHWPERAGFAQV